MFSALIILSYPLPRGYLVQLPSIFRLTFFLIILVTSLAHTTVNAKQPATHFSDAEIKGYLELAEEQKLHEQTHWLRLVHYEKKRFRKAFYSLVNDDTFFLSPSGPNSPKAEMLSTLQQLLNNTENNDQNIWCRFPARARWLSKSLNIPQNRFAQYSCVEYNEWLSTMDADSAWLIFPAAHLNSPSSMFGHTLLRLDPPQHQNSSKLLGKAINYAANIKTKDSEIVFAYKGLFGGYPGEFTIVPYHKKVKEYGLMERRDIWEYKLNVSTEEMERLLHHLWELKEVQFNYLFASKNCSYQLLTLLDIARPSSALTDDFKAQTIPIDTVRSLAKRGWIDSTHFRPSQSKQFYALEKLLSEDEAEAVKALQEDLPQDIMKNLADQPISRQQMVLEAAYKLSRINKSKVDSKQYLKLLRYRSQLGKKQFSNPEITGVEPEKSHFSKRITAGGYTQTLNGEHSDGVVLSFRPAFHSLSDRLEGFTPGAQINFLQFDFLASQGKLKLNTLNVVDIRSLSESNEYIKQLSWQVVGGVDRKLNRRGEHIAMSQLATELGQTYRFGPVRLYALAGFHIEHDRTEAPLLSFGPTVDTGIILQTHHITGELRFEYDFTTHNERGRQKTSLIGQIPLSQNWSIALNITRETLDSIKIKQGSLQLQHYY